MKNENNIYITENNALWILHDGIEIGSPSKINFDLVCSVLLIIVILETLHTFLRFTQMEELFAKVEKTSDSAVNSSRKLNENIKVRSHI